MITPEILAIVMFLTTLGLLLFGFPVAFTLAPASASLAVQYGAATACSIETINLSLK